MGVNYSAHVVVGIRVFEEDLIVHGDPVWTCRNGHIHPKTVKFCSEDGLKVEPRRSKSPTRSFEQFCRARSIEPSYVDVAISTLTDGIKIFHDVSPLQTSESKATLAVGIRIATVSEYDASQAITMDALGLHAAKVKTVAREMGIDADSRDVEVFTSMCIY